MKQDLHKTIVVFRRFVSDDAIVALFPAEVNYPDGACESYMHIGQHGAADYSHCLRITRPATPAEYAPLKRELEGIGYELEIRKRYTVRRRA